MRFRLTILFLLCGTLAGFTACKESASSNPEIPESSAKENPSQSNSKSFCAENFNLSSQSSAYWANQLKDTLASANSICLDTILNKYKETSGDDLNTISFLDENLITQPLSFFAISGIQNRWNRDYLENSGTPPQQLFGVEIIEILINHGIDLNITNREGLDLVSFIFSNLYSSQNDQMATLILENEEFHWNIYSESIKKEIIRRKKESSLKALLKRMGNLQVTRVSDEDDLSSSLVSHIFSIENPWNSGLTTTLEEAKKRFLDSNNENSEVTWSPDPIFLKELAAPKFNFQDEAYKTLVDYYPLDILNSRILGDPFIFRAVKEKNLDLIDYLITREIDTNVYSSKNESPLYLAIRLVGEANHENEKEVLYHLIHKISNAPQTELIFGKQPTQNDRADTPMDLARRLGDETVQNILLEADLL